MSAKGKKAYREFLKSDFWKELSKAKKEMVCRCERCGESETLQSHHKRYPEDWFDTTLEDLEVLCRSCHREEHGIIRVPFMLYPGRGYKFNRTLDRISRLTRKVAERNKTLNRREVRFLIMAWKAHKPTPTDGCLRFQVGLVFSLQERMFNYEAKVTGSGLASTLFTHKLT